jgi:dynein heavy chain
MRMLFEVQDLAVASPATVSRCGMVYVTQAATGWRPYVQSWLKLFHPEVLSEKLREHLYKLFEKYFPDALAFKTKEGREPIPMTEVAVAASVCELFSALFDPARTNFAAAYDEVVSFMNMNFIFSMAWSFGGSMDAASMAKLNAFLFKAFNKEEKIPPNLFEVWVDPLSKAWKNWEDIVPAFVYNASTPYFDMLVPTIDTVRYSYLAETLLDVQRSVFFTGVSGIGKSVTAGALLKRTMDTKSYLPVTITFSAQTASKRVQEQIESIMEKKTRTKLGAPAGKKAVIFVDDVNMPAVETYGAMPPIELLRQFQDFKGFYERKKIGEGFWRDIVDTTIMCCSAPPGGGRNELTPRFVRHFHVLCLPQPSDGAMLKIFGTILKSFLAAGFKKEYIDLAEGMAKSTIQMYNGISTELLPTPAKSHYTFNLRDISKVFQGMLGITPKFCPNVDTMVRLWIHETARCFHDRLINDNDKEWFNERIIKLLGDNLSVRWDYNEVFVKRNIMFGDWFRPGLERMYEEATDPKKVGKLLDDFLDESNSSSPNRMNLVFFEDAVKHISRIVRIIRQPRGNAMLVGVGGSGKQSLTRLSAFISDLSLFQLEIIKGYGYDLFREDMKKIIMAAGAEGKQTLFYFPDNHIVDERFLEDVNNLLNSGEIPNLFEADERQRISDAVTPVVVASGYALCGFVICI